MDQQKSLFDLSVDAFGKAHLKEAAKWARFLALAGLILLGIAIVILLISLIVSLDQKPVYKFNNEYTAGYLIGMFMAALIMSSIYIYPCITLLRFARKTITALDTNDVASLNESFRSLKQTLRYIGVLMIFFLALFLLGILGNLG